MVIIIKPIVISTARKSILVRHIAGRSSRMGTRAYSMRRPTPLALTISQAWPIKLKPVTSVPALRLNWFASWAGFWFNRFIQVTTSATSASMAMPRFKAVVVTPKPSGFVSTNRSVGCIPCLVNKFLFPQNLMLPGHIWALYPEPCAHRQSLPPLHVLFQLLRAISLRSGQLADQVEKQQC